MNYSIQEWKTLYCDCGGNASGISIQKKMEEKINRLHQEAWFQGIVYVCVIVSLYIIGLCLIVINSGTKWHSTTAFIASIFDHSESMSHSGRYRSNKPEGVTLPSSSRKRRFSRRRHSEAADEDGGQTPIKTPSIKVTVEPPSKTKLSADESAAAKISSTTLDSFI